MSVSQQRQAFEFDVFVSYRWVEPDQTWVRNDFVPALQSAGLKVCIDVNDFVPGRDLILEMTRAGQTSRRALCILSEDYFDGNRMVHFESLAARRADPSGLESRLIPLLLRPTQLPEWLRGLILVDWTDPNGHTREWDKLLRVLEAPRASQPPSRLMVGTARHRPTAVFIHDYNLPHTFVARESELARLSEVLSGSADDPARARVVAVTAIGGVGKSCLCRALIERQEIATSFSRIVWFSFYEARAESEDYFLRQLLQYGYEKEPRDDSLNANDRQHLRRAVADILSRERTLLVLDGLEVVQFTDDPDSAKYGEIKPIWGEIDKLLRNLLNNSQSVCLATSRVALRALEPIRGFYQLSLDLLTPADGAALLRSLGVDGSGSELEACAAHLGGHALSLVAAGRFFARRRMSAGKLADLVGDVNIFARTTEGEKIKRICEWYRSELTTEQAYFLTRLSLHGRSITPANYPAVIPSYRGPDSDREAEEHIVQPLVDRGLVDRLESNDSIIRYSAHPLMKLAYSTWLDPDERRRSHEEWARAAAAAPGVSLLVPEASTLEELQPLVDATEHYLAAGNWREAWRIYSDRGVGGRLGQLGYFEQSLSIAKQFEPVQRTEDWSALESVLLLDILAWLSNIVGRSEDALNYRRAELAAARLGRISDLDKVEELVASSLAEAGFGQEAAQIRPRSRRARGRIALAQGHYKRAVALLRAVLREARGHNMTVIAQPLAEAMYRDGAYQAAADVLHNALKVATDEGFTCCQKEILWKLVDVALRRCDRSDAVRWWEAYVTLCRRLGLDWNEHSWLLLEQGDVEGALVAAEAAADAFPGSKVRRHVEIARILLRSGDRDQAMTELSAAELIQSSTGYRGSRNDVVQLRKDMSR
jgi:hypothetical protein